METYEPMQPTKETLVSPLFLFVSYAVTLFVFIALVFRWSSFFTPNEKPITLKFITTQKKQEFQGDPVAVRIGLFINDFYKFDINADDFIFNGILTYEFDPSLISLKTLEQASFDRGEIVYRSSPTTHIERGRMNARYDVRVKFSSNLDFSWFPFEDHRISIVFIDKSLSPAELIFETSNDNFSAPDMNSVGWYKFDTRATAGYLDAPLRQGTIAYPAILFTIDYGRHKNLRNIFTIILPMLLLFFIALFSIIINTTDKSNFTFVIGMPVQTIVGLIAFRFVIESISPKVGYFMYSDFFFFLFLFLMFTILLFHTFGSSAGSFARKIMIVVYNGIVIGFACYFLMFVSSATPLT